MLSDVDAKLYVSSFDRVDNYASIYIYTYRILDISCPYVKSLAISKLEEIRFSLNLDLQTT